MSLESPTAAAETTSTTAATPETSRHHPLRHAFVDKMSSGGGFSLAHAFNPLRSKVRSDSPPAKKSSAQQLPSASSRSASQPRSKSREGTRAGDENGIKSTSPPRAESTGRSCSRDKNKEDKAADRRERRLLEQDMVDEFRRVEDQKARENVDEETKARYGDDPPPVPDRLMTIAEAADKPVGTEVVFRARIHHQRDVSKALDFLLLRDQTHSIQGVLSGPPEMVKWAQRLHAESIVQVRGVLQRPPVDSVRSASHGDREVLIETLHLVAPARGLPFNNYNPPGAMHPRVSSRVLDLRHPANQALFRVRAAIAREFRRALEDQGFIEIHTPKLQPAATESGAEVFKVNYFGRSAFLAQSPQLAKQMAVSADFKRVYECGSVFRAENSNTHRHLTEYTGLDMEMAIDSSYHEVLHTIDRVLKSIFSAVRAMEADLGIIRERWPSRDLVWLDETPIIPFCDAMQMLLDDAEGGSGGGGSGVGDDDDFSTRDELRLGELVKKRYGTDYFIVDKFPTAARPFYTHRDETDPRWTNSFDVFLRGQEIATGGQRIHNADELRRSIAEAGMAEDGLEDYIDAFEFGAPPHGGVGLGLERIVTFLLELGDVRLASPFHRDPKSLPSRPPALPHPEASTKRRARTLPPPTSSPHPQPASPASSGGHEGEAHDEYPPLEKLIANYGDAANTSWLDDRFELWRHKPTGAAVGFKKQGDKLVMVTGDPLCDTSQLSEVIAGFVRFAEEELHRTPVFLISSEEVQTILSNEHGWRALTCIEEQRIDPESRQARHRNGALDRNARRVQREGIRIREVRPDKDPGFVARTDAALERWREGRRGKKQVHLTEVKPWVDMAHRRYFAAERGEDRAVVALVVLARLAPRHGWQVKWAIDMGPNGTIEVLVERALSAVSGSPVTFGTGVSKTLQPKAHISTARARVLQKMYEALSRPLGLGRKAEFRERFGVIGDPVYICYPKHGLGVGDLREIVRFFED